MELIDSVIATGSFRCWLRNREEPANPVTNGTEERAHFSEVTLFEDLNCVNNCFWGRKGVLFKEVCPFRGVFRESGSAVEYSPIIPHFNFNDKNQRGRL